MIEAMIRLSKDKYVTHGNTKSVYEGVIQAWENNYEPYFKTFDCHVFRTERLWKEEMDVLLTRILSGL